MAGTVYPVNANSIKVKAHSTSTQSATYNTIADMESAAINVDTGVETWYGLAEGGWQKALATSKALTVDMAGKRSYGDTGNDLIAGMWNTNGTSALVDVEITLPDTATITFTAVVQITNIWGGDATAVGALEFTLICDGKPEYTPAAA